MNILAENLLILASAGSGKTFQLASRVIGLVAKGADPRHIVALTFTRKAAGEFADSVLTKLAGAAEDEEAALELRAALGLPEADFHESLERVVRALPNFTLGTMDSYFARIVRAFQHELGLTGGRFELVEGPKAQSLTDELLASILSDTLASESSEEFFHAFRRATAGREDQGVLNALRSFVNRWQLLYQEKCGLEWGPASMVEVSPLDWQKHRSSLAAIILRGLDGITYTRAGQREALEKEIQILHDHVIGGGSLGNRTSKLMESILEAAGTPDGPLILKSYKEFEVGGPAGEALRNMVQLAARCEFAAALQRTRAVKEVVASFDDLCAKRLRNKGLLGFNDVKQLMGTWAKTEDARLRREAVDFRLDGRTHHWLLDEFQDTSRADWLGLQPWIDEAASDPECSMFIVGDRKQAIYAWRGGDVGLFDEIIRRYGRGLEISTMAESWRSCPEVLDLVNRVCGDQTTLQELFGEVAGNWEWEHHFSAAPLAGPSKRGHATVEVVGDWDDRLARMVEILRDLGVGQRAITCGILLRGNNRAREVTDFLRTHGFDVIEEGRREPAKDNPVGIVIHHLLKWLANPADAFAREVVAMSPVHTVLQGRFGASPSDIWEGLNDEISRTGFHPTFALVLEQTLADGSEFGRRRAGDLLMALATLDATGVASLAEAAAWVGRLEISQSPGIAAIQVMTIHKSKGLGFDVVLLPDIPDENIPQPQHFEVAEGTGWISQTPPKWVRNQILQLREAEENWASKQRYEALCLLYVALTRAKRGLHILLSPPAKSLAEDKPSLTNWLRNSLAAHNSPGTIYECGAAGWTASFPGVEPQAQPETPSRLITASARKDSLSATAGDTQSGSHGFSAAALKFGMEIHTILQNVSWLDESPPVFPDSPAGRHVSTVIKTPGLEEIFERRGRNVELFREQTIDAVAGGLHLSGVIDRLHITHEPGGKVSKVEIIDFKTDAVASASDLISRYSGQMDFYREIMKRVYPQAEISCVLLSLKHSRLVRH